MPNLKILKQMGSTDDLLRQIFTSKPVSREANPNLSQEEADRIDEHVAIRERWESKIQNRLTQHMDFSLKNHHIYSAVDVAWDSPPVTKNLVPLLLYAQGRLDHAQCVKSLENCLGKEKCAKFIKRDEKGEGIIDIPKFVETHMNLVRSFVTRRLAAQSAKYSNLYPFYKYEPRSTLPADKLKADVLSQRVDQMADDYGYRNHDIQVLRNALLYAYSIDFIASKWDVQYSVTGVEIDGDNKVRETKSSIDREGLQWTTPHPLRTFWDNSSPISAINTGDMDYIGYWDIVPYRDLRHVSEFYNQNDITYGETLMDWLSSYAEFFNLYYSKTIRHEQFVTETDESTTGQAADNDRAGNIGRYAGCVEDAGCVIATYFEKVVPADEGFGGYPEPVWVRFLVAGDKTVIHAEFLPSTPAAYCGYNVKEDRQVNISFAHEVMPFQDQMSNLTTQMLDLAKRSQFVIYQIDEDFFDETQVEDIRSKINSKNWDMTPMSISVSRSKMSELGVQTEKAVQIIQPTLDPNAFQIVFQSMTNMIQLAERVTAMSANEVGQPIVRGNGGVTATEADQIGQATNNVHGMVSDAFDEFRAAKKRIIYQSLVECHRGDIIVPVLNRYPKNVIAKARFQISNEEEHRVAKDDTVSGVTLIGTPESIRHNYIFTSRDGSERANNINAANALIALFGVIKDPMILNAVGKEKLFEMLNAVFRMMDAGVDLNLEVQPGEEDFVNQSDQIIEAISKLSELVQVNQQEIAALKQPAAEQQSA